MLSVGYAEESCNMSDLSEAIYGTQIHFHEPPRRYSKACIYGDLIFLSGEDSKDPTTQKVQGT